MKKILFVYDGEFGWEFHSVHAWINQILESKLYEISLVDFESSRGLYFDMDIKFEAHNIQGRTSGRGSDNIFDLVDIKKYNYDELVCPSVQWSDNVIKSLDGKRQLYREVRLDINPEKKEKKICVHARKIPFKDARDWFDHQNGVLELMKDMGFELSFVGHPEYSLAFPQYGEDCRTIDLTSTITHIKESFLVFGPASGASILSLYCKIPVFTWSCGSQRMRQEIRDIDWNPFETTHYHPWFDTEGWPNEINTKYTQHSSLTTVDELKTGIVKCLKHMGKIS